MRLSALSIALHIIGSCLDWAKGFAPFPGASPVILHRRSMLIFGSAVSKNLNNLIGPQGELTLTDSMLNQIIDSLALRMEGDFSSSSDTDDDEEENANNEHSLQVDQVTVDQNTLLNGVVRVHCTHSEPNFGMPWQRLRQECSTSSGFVIDTEQGLRILTNAHAVEYGSLVQVKKRQSEKKYLATVIAGNMHECCTLPLY